MRYILIFVGAAVVAWLLVLGVRAFIAEHRSKQQPNILREDRPTQQDTAGEEHDG